MKFSIKSLFSKCGQIRKKLRVWAHLLKKSVTGNFIFWVVLNFILIQSRLEKKQSKGYFLMCSIVEDEVKNFEFSGFIVSTKI